jgi:ABC-2 type transport system permease protein
VLGTVGLLVGSGFRAPGYFPGDLAARCLGLSVRIYLYGALWSALYADRDSVVDGFSLSQAIGYSVMAMVIVSFADWPAESLSHRVRTGSIAYSLLRPVSAVTSSIAMDFGRYSFSLLLLLAIEGAGAIFGLLPHPYNFQLWILFVMSLFLGGLIQVLLESHVEMSAFWFTDVYGIQSLFRFTSQLLTGALVPLAFFPSAAKSVIDMLPFGSVVYDPLSIGVGTVTNPSSAAHLLVRQCAWLVVLLLSSQIVWIRARKRVNLQGG